MLKLVEGIFRNGKIELLEVPADVTEARVVVTFLPVAGPIDLASVGIDAKRAAEMRNRLKSFAQDWDRPDMGVYDDQPPVWSASADAGACVGRSNVTSPRAG